MTRREQTTASCFRMAERTRHAISIITITEKISGDTLTTWVVLPRCCEAASSDIEVNTQILFDYGDQYQNRKKCMASCAICCQENTGHNITQTEDTTEDTNSKGNTPQKSEDPNQVAKSKGSDKTRCLAFFNTSKEGETSNVSQEVDADSDSESTDDIFGVDLFSMID